MNVISTTIDFNGVPVKVEGGNVFLRCFGTTINNHSMHWSWTRVEIGNLSPKLKQLLKENNLI